MDSKVTKALRAARHLMHRFLGDSPKTVRLADIAASHAEGCACDFCRRAEMRWEETT